MADSDYAAIELPKGQFAPQALLSTDPGLSAAEVVSAFARRWAMESTFQEACAHLGIEGERQCNDLGIARSRPLRLAFFSLVALIVHGQPAWQQSVRQAAWYKKVLPTFCNALAQVRRCLWQPMGCWLSQENTDS